MGFRSAIEILSDLSACLVEANRVHRERFDLYFPAFTEVEPINAKTTLGNTGPALPLSSSGTKSSVAETVLVLTTGGTIDKIYFDAKSTYHVGPPQILEILSGFSVAVPFSVESVFSKDSLDMTDEDRNEIRRRVRDAEQRRILITHGTDTMVKTGKALGEVKEKTVVFVGSLSPSRFKGSDAEFNVGFAFAVVQLLPPGVYIAMNGSVFGVHEVRKNVEQNRFEFDGS